MIADDKRSCAMIEVNCETDFVAREDNFVQFVSELAALVCTRKYKTNSLEQATLSNGDSVEAARANSIEDR